MSKITTPYDARKAVEDAKAKREAAKARGLRGTNLKSFHKAVADAEAIEKAVLKVIKDSKKG